MCFIFNSRLQNPIWHTQSPSCVWLMYWQNTHFFVSPRTAGLHVLNLRWCEEQLHRSALKLTCWCSLTFTDCFACSRRGKNPAKCYCGLNAETIRYGQCVLWCEVTLSLLNMKNFDCGYYSITLLFWFLQHVFCIIIICYMT